MEYKEQIKSPKWQKRRLEILQRDNFTCQICGDTKSELNVHHLHYEKGKKIWEYPDSDLITLCQVCHEAEHDKDGEFSVDNVINELKKQNITMHEIRIFLSNMKKNIEENSFAIKMYNRFQNVDEGLSRLAIRRIETKEKSHE